MNAIANVAAATPVSVHGFTWTAALVAILNLLIGGALVAVIKNWPKLKELAIKARRDDMDDMRQRITELETVAKNASEKAHRSEMIVVTVVAAFQLAMGELEKLDPENKVLKQARELMAVAMTGDFGMDASLHKLASFQVAAE